MNKIAENLKTKITNEIIPQLEVFKNAGVDMGRIRDIVDDHIKKSCIKFYQKKRTWSDEVIEYLEDIKNKQSKAEAIFYNMLVESGIDFKFQYPIGPYKIDYFIPINLLIELDGPYHGKKAQKKKDLRRDKYLTNMGYRIERIPIYLVALDHEAVINSIKELI